DHRARARGARLRRDRGGARHVGGRRAQTGQQGVGERERQDGDAPMTTPDFQTQLKLQLRDAARRDERRSPAARWARGLPRLTPAVAVAAVVVIALAVLLGLSLRGTSPDRQAAPKKVESFSVTPTLGAVI